RAAGVGGGSRGSRSPGPVGPRARALCPRRQRRCVVPRVTARPLPREPASREESARGGGARAALRAAETVDPGSAGGGRVADAAAPRARPFWGGGPVPEEPRAPRPARRDQPDGTPAAPP